MHVVAAIIQNERGEILICRRGPGGSCGLLWEFPGGKLEPGETAGACAVRECQEELNITIAVRREFAQTSYQYPERAIDFTFFLASIVEGDPVRTVHQEIRWVLPSQLGQFPFCPADLGILEMLQASPC